MKEEVSTAPVPAANAWVAQADAITPAIVQNMVAFFAPRVSLESHLCFGAEVVAAVSIAVASTAEIFSSFIGKKSPSKK